MLTRLVPVFSALALAAASSFAQPPASDPKKPAPTPAPQPSKPADQPKTPPEAPKPAGNPDAAKPAPATEKLVFCKMSTSMGDIVLELNNEKAPISTANFLSYVDKHFYDGTIFHRVIPDFMIQGGGFDKDMNQKKTDGPIKNEWTNGLKNVRGSLAMARLPAADSATSQFFINVVNNDASGTGKTNLDQPSGPPGAAAAYAVFGRVAAGMDVVDKIKAVQTTNKGPHQNVPVEPVLIKSVVRMTPDEAAAAIKSATPAAPTAPAATPENPKPPAGAAPPPKPSK